MDSQETPQIDERVERLNGVISFPEGLPAFEQIKEFRIVSNEEEAPFLWLQAVGMPELAFITIDPFLVYPEYRPDIPDSDVKELGIEKPDDVFMLSIVNIRHNPDSEVTANLVSPVVINTQECVGKQVILQNHLQYSVRYRIDQAEG